MSSSYYYPSELRGALHASKSRTVSVPYTTQQPQSGPAYFVRRTTGTREEWDLVFEFSRFDAAKFEAWLSQVGFGNSVWDAIPNADNFFFWLPLKDERGYSLVECAFLQWPTCTDRATWRYTARIVVRDRVDLVTHEGVPVIHEGDYVTYG